jgi:zinc/manganese transport system permease protein
LGGEAGAPGAGVTVAALALVGASSGPGGLLGQAFLRNAFLAGTAIAAACGLVGYFLVLRSQVFTGDALSHVAFTGAVAALSFGVDPRLGLFVATIGVGILMGTLGPRGQADDVVVGSVFAWILGLGVLFLTIFTTSRSTADSTAGVSVLFGSIFGLSHGQTLAATAIAAAIVVLVALIARPLLFASIDPAVATARHVPVVVLGLGFLALVGACAAEATQAVGALLLLGLLAAPAGTAQQLTVRPYRALALSCALAVGEMWGGLTLSYAFPHLPPSFCVISVAAGVYLVVLAVTRVRPMASARTWTAASSGETDGAVARPRRG